MCVYVYIYKICGVCVDILCMYSKKADTSQSLTSNTIFQKYKYKLEIPAHSLEVAFPLRMNFVFTPLRTCGNSPISAKHAGIPGVCPYAMAAKTYLHCWQRQLEYPPNPLHSSHYRAFRFYPSSAAGRLFTAQLQRSLLLRFHGPSKIGSSSSRSFH